MGIDANVAGRKAAETIAQLITDELTRLLVEFGLRSGASDVFFEKLRNEFPGGLTIEVERGRNALRPMSDQQAREFGQRLMPWGKHRGARIDAVPLDYLEWCASRPDEFKDDLNNYLMSRRVMVESEGAAPTWAADEEIPF